MEKKDRKLSKQKLSKVLKVLAILCVIVLLIEGIYLAYLYCSREAKKVYSSVASTFIKDGTDFYLVGSSDFKKSKIGYQKGYQKARFARYNKDGKLLVEEAFLDGYNSIYNDVSKVGKNYVAVGQYEKTKQDNKENTGTGIIVKYNKDGKVLDKKEILVLADTTFKKVKPLSDGGYIVVGQTIFENMTLGFDDRGGGIIIRYSKDDKEVWRANYGGSKSGTFNDLLIDEENNAIYVVGKDAARTGIFVKYDLDGKRIFSKNYSSTDTIGFSAIEELGGNYIVVGSKKSSEDKEDYHTEALLVKYDKNGKMLWDKTYKKNDMNRFNDIAIQNNTIYLVGHTAVLNKENSTEATRAFDYTGIFASFTKDGKIIASKEWKEKNKETYFSAIIKDKNGCYLTGQSNGQKLSNNKDMKEFIIKVDNQGN